jgi:diguanylate cyclase (GGDEF)-like protein
VGSEVLLDVRTVALCNAAASFVFALTLASTRSRLVEMHGVREFSLAAALCGTGFILSAFQGAIFPVEVHVLLAVPMMTFAVGLMYCGVCRFTGKDNPMRWVLASASAVLAVTALSLYSPILLPVRLIVFSVVGATWSFFAASHTLRFADKALGFGRQLGAYALIAIGVTFVVRAISLFVVEIDPNPLANTATNRVSFFAGTVLMMLALAGATAMVNTRIGLEIARIAERDVLTGVLSRFGLKHASLRFAAQHPRSSLLLIDLDHFKQVNDTLGHDRGDDVLRAFSQLAQSKLPEEAQIARYGGDEFVILLPSRIDPEYFGRSLITEFDERIAVLMKFESQLVQLPSLSIGIALLDSAFGVAIRNADRALYRAKSEGRSRIAVWSSADPITIARSA